MVLKLELLKAAQEAVIAQTANVTKQRKELTATKSEPCWFSSKHGELNDDLCRLKLHHAADATKPKDPKSVARKRERPAKRENMTCSCV